MFVEGAGGMFVEGGVTPTMKPKLCFEDFLRHNVSGSGGSDMRLALDVLGGLAICGEADRPAQCMPLLRAMFTDAPPPGGNAVAPEAVRSVMAHPRAVLRTSAVLSGSRGFWMVRLAAEIQKRLGGVVHLPASGEIFTDVARFEASWPGDHGAG